MGDHETLDVLTRYLALELKKIDDLYIANKLTTAEYMVIGIQLRQLEAMDNQNHKIDKFIGLVEDLLKYK